jgi:shikimate dehydrogenase
MSSTELSTKTIINDVKITPLTKFIIGTSGRIESMNRYNKLLQNILKKDLAYIPISSSNLNDNRILPENFDMTLRGMNCIGGAISRDIKQAIIPFLDRLDETASSIGSVNTIIVERNSEENKKGHGGCHLVGYNTDLIGFRESIILSINNSMKPVKTALIYGYGGVSATVVYVLTKLGIDVFITGRRKEEALKRSIILGCKLWNVDDNIDLFINATPVTDSPLDQADGFLICLKTCHLVFDHELKGSYLKKYCDDNNIKHISGMTMYYPQVKLIYIIYLIYIIIINNISSFFLNRCLVNGHYF